MKKGTIFVIASLVLWFLFQGLKPAANLEGKVGGRMAAIEKEVGGQQ